MHSIGKTLHRAISAIPALKTEASPGWEDFLVEIMEKLASNRFSSRIPSLEAYLLRLKTLWNWYFLRMFSFYIFMVA